MKSRGGCHRAGESVTAMSKPELYQDLMPLWEFYVSLQEREQIIRMESIESWLRIHDVKPEDVKEMTRLILLLNGKFIKHINSKKGK